tara:strand:+ start:1925 stop:2674 length:750 start_codon:yes stop_codon:yes gene_type:complete
MCISAEASINSFFFNLVSVILLIQYGNDNLKLYNLIIGMFAIFTSLMQLVDLGIWLDLDCKRGLNKFVSKVGPILNHLQPTMIFVIAFLVIKYTDVGKEVNENLKNTKFENFMITTEKINYNNVINLLYFCLISYVLVIYYIKESKSSSAFCSTVFKNHIRWNWTDIYKDNITYSIIYTLLYALIGTMNFYTINPFSSYIKLVLILYFFQYSIAKTISRIHLSEIWCLISNSLPLTLLILQKIFPKYLN